jgi:hypothetical protein
VALVRRAEYPYFCWDKLLIPGPEESILRVDHVFPVPKEPGTVELLPHRLSDKALEIMDDWILWLVRGTLDGASDLA